MLIVFLARTKKIAGPRSKNGPAALNVRALFFQRKENFTTKVAARAFRLRPSKNNDWEMAHA
ncbi:MAG: hypothetical protein DMG35_15225 [Acidobacteria bacterium]|nr:MAG: hypothetical protein DMG35_15225 [Acidobacteriota bacterium]